MLQMSDVSTWLRGLFNRETLREDAVSGLVLGVESVPDGLAGGLLAGVNPVFGLYGYMVGTMTGALFTSATFMAVQATGAMAIIVADVPAVHSGTDPERALFTLAVLTGVVMLVAGLFKLGSLLRWVSNAVLVGFINAVGVNIVLGQLDNFSGYEAEGANRIARALNLLFNIFQAHWPSMIIGATTIALIILLERTRLGPLGMVVAIVATSIGVVLFGMDNVEQLRDITDVPRSLPLPVFPNLRLIPVLIVPAISLAFVGLVQGAGISANFPNPDGNYPDASQDFVGQGAANIASGILQGMPVGGSMSASSLVKTAGARSKGALIIAGGVMAVSILVLGDVVGFIAMPALAGLLMIVGYRTVKPADIAAVWRTGSTQAVVMTVTFALTMLIPLQNAVLVGVGISIILFVIGQSNRIAIKQWIVNDDRRLRETDAPDNIGADEALIIQPYGSLFFASAPVFEEELPGVIADTSNSVVILRLRGKSDLGSTFMEVVSRYAESLIASDSKLVLVYSHPRVRDQLNAMGVTDLLGAENLYESDEWLGTTAIRAHDDALEWIRERGTEQ
ncbi:MAG: SulP family inorganic anion transporter [Actinomycetota bacterium]